MRNSGMDIEEYPYKLPPWTPTGTTTVLISPLDHPIDCHYTLPPASAACTVTAVNQHGITREAWERLNEREHKIQAFDNLKDRIDALMDDCEYLREALADAKTEARDHLLAVQVAGQRYQRMHAILEEIAEEGDEHSRKLAQEALGE